MEYKKDYSLLRPFDLESAKRGDNVCWHEDGDTAIEVFFPKQGGIIPVFNGNDQCGIFTDMDYEQLKMSPLAWVEGRPVYVGDVLYPTTKGAALDSIKITSVTNNGDVSNGYWCIDPNYLTWTKLKQKREGWVNVYPDKCAVSYRYDTEQQALEAKVFNALATVRIEWEE